MSGPWVRLTGGLVLIALSTACICEKRTLTEIKSPQGTKARVLSVDCGATTAVAMNVEVAGWFSSTLVLATRDTEPPELEFADGGKTLIVSVPQSTPDGYIYPYAREAHGVKVVVRRPP